MWRTASAWLARACAVTLALASPVHAAEMLTNGSFELSTYASGGPAFPGVFLGSYGVGTGVEGAATYDSTNPSVQANPNVPWGKNFLTGWDVTGYTFIYAPGKADTDGSWNGYGPIRMAGPGTPDGYASANGMTATSPDGGFYLAVDGAKDGGIDFTGTISQTVNVVAGQQYAVSFYWAAAQQAGPDYDGPTTEQWIVSLGNETDNWVQTQATDVWNNPARGFKPWSQETFVFTAQTTGAATLQFLSKGTPEGQPPFTLLDGVSMTDYVPEPQTWAMMLIGFALIGGTMRSRRQPMAGRRLLNSQIV